MGRISSPRLPDVALVELIERLKRREPTSDQLTEDLSHALQAIETLSEHLEAEVDAKRALEHDLDEAKTRYETLVDNAYEGVALIQGDRFVSINPSVTRIIGRSRDDLMSQPFHEFIHPDDRADVIESRKEALSGQSTLEPYGFRVLAGDHSVRWVRARAVITELEGEPAMLCLFNDITENKQTEYALRRTKFAMDSAAYSVFQVERDGRISYCNDTAATTRGYTKDEILGLTVADIDVEQTPKSFRKIWEAARLGSAKTIESTHQRKDGSTFPVEVSISFFNDDGEEFCFVFVRDISERRRSEAQRAQMELQIRQQQKIESISTLASGVAHEINNPINIVMNYAELIMSRCDDSSKVGDFAQEIIQESQRIASIVRNLLAFAREEREPQQLTAIGDVIDRSLSLMREVLRKRGIQLQVQLEDDLPEISCRFQRIQQVLMNLITNAMDALEEVDLADREMKTIKVSAYRLQNERGDWVRTVVEDNGAGIPDDIADRVFDPFFTSKARERGTGLGLSVSHGIVSEHGGELSFSTKESQFTRFYIDLPVPGPESS